MIDKRRDLLRIRIELIGILPPIWREILVPAGYSFWDLHVAMQDAMGWLDYHLHEFRIPATTSTEQVLVGIPAEEDWDDSPEVLPGWEVPVLSLLSRPGASAEYEYDFGDGWLHAVNLLAVEPRVSGRGYPDCVAGERACPPEDCGGPQGYQALLDALFDPASPDYRSMTEWIPSNWGPEKFRPEAVRFDNPRRRWLRAFCEQD